MNRFPCQLSWMNSMSTVGIAIYCDYASLWISASGKSPPTFCSPSTLEPRQTVFSCFQFLYFLSFDIFVKKYHTYQLWSISMKFPPLHLQQRSKILIIYICFSCCSLWIKLHLYYTPWPHFMLSYFEMAYSWYRTR